MHKLLVLDTSSLIVFFRYYGFDRENGAIEYDKLKNFLIEKIVSGEIIVIDKVFEEIKDWGIFVKDFKIKIKDKIIDTNPLIGIVKEISNNFYIEENEKILNNDLNKINQAVNDYENINADAFLIAKCLSLKENGEQPILITEETKRKDTKLFPKIPFICKEMNIECRSMPYSIFEIYKSQLKFIIEVN